MAARELLENLPGAKPTNLLLRIKQLEEELAELGNHVRSLNEFKITVENTLKNTGIELEVLPRSAGDNNRYENISTGNLKAKEKSHELSDTEVQDPLDALFRDSDLDRELSPCIDELSLGWSDVESEKSTEIGYSEAQGDHRPSLSTDWGRNSVELFENNLDPSKNAVVPVRAVPPAKPFISASFRKKSSSRHRRIKLPKPEAKRKSLPRKVAQPKAKELALVSVSKISEQKKHSEQIDRQLAEECLRVTGSGQQKVYTCVCSKQFDQKPSAVKHAIFAHGRDRNFPCESCDLKYKNQWDLQRHITREHQSSFHSPGSSSSAFVAASSVRPSQKNPSRTKLITSCNSGNLAAQIPYQQTAWMQGNYDTKLSKCYGLNCSEEPGSGSYRCLMCEFQHDVDRSMRKHAARKHVCPYCTVTKTDSNELEQHIIKDCYTKYKRGQGMKLVSKLNNGRKATNGAMHTITYYSK